MVGLAEVLLRLNDLMKVRVHQLHGDVQLRVVVTRPKVRQRDDVRMNVEQPHQLNLAQRVARFPLVASVGLDPLDRHFFVARRVGRGDHHAIAALTHDRIRCDRGLTREGRGVR